MMLRLMLSLPLLCLIPGYLILRAARGGVPPSARFSRRAWLQAVTAGMAIASWIGLVLLECGCFTVASLVSALGAFSIALYLIYRPPLSGGRAAERVAPQVWPLSIVLAGFAAACFAAGSSEYVFGGWDSGEYVNMGALIAERNRIVYRDDFFASLPPEARALFTEGGRRYMGFNLTGPEGATVSPKFMHLYPLWLSLAIRLAGLRAAFSLNVLFALLSIALCCLIALRLRGPGAGFAAAAFMAAGAVELWFARSQCAEPLAQAFFLGAVYFWVLWRRGGGAVYAGLAAAALGMMCLTKFDTAVVLPAAATALFFSERKRGGGAFAIVLLAAAGHLAIHLVWWDRPYARAILDNLPAPFRGNAPLALSIAPALVLLAALLRRARARRFALAPPGPRARLLSGIGGLLALAFLYFVRPAVSRSPEAGNLAEFGRVLGDGFFWWGAAACAWAWMRGLQDDERLLWWAAVAATAVLSVSLAGERHLYPWSARRFLPVTVPALAIFAGCFTAEVCACAGRRGWWLPAAGAGLLAISALARYPFMLTARDFPGAAAFISRLGEAVKGFDIVICEQVRLAVPLDYLCRRRVLLFKDDAQTAERCRRVERLVALWLGEGKRVAYVTTGPPVHGSTIAFERAQTLSLATSLLPLARHGMPAGPAGTVLQAKIFEAVPLQKSCVSGAFEVAAGYNCFNIESGFSGVRRGGTGGGVGRWTGRRASLIIPWWGEGAGAEIALSLAAGESAAVPVEVSVAGRRVATLAVRGPRAEYTAAVPGGTGAGRKRVRLELFSPRSVFLDSVRVKKKIQ